MSNPKIQSQIRLPLNLLFLVFSAIALFDGSFVDGKCGSGKVIKINDDHFFHIGMWSGIGSNTRVELSGIWGVLFFVEKLGIDSINIFGD